MTKEVVEIYVSDMPLEQDDPTSCCILRDGQIAGRHLYYKVFGVINAPKYDIEVPQGYHAVSAVRRQIRDRAISLYVKASTINNTENPDGDDFESEPDETAWEPYRRTPIP